MILTKLFINKQNYLLTRWSSHIRYKILYICRMYKITIGSNRYSIFMKYLALSIDIHHINNHITRKIINLSKQNEANKNENNDHSKFYKKENA